jgi:hypothetical protein
VEENKELIRADRLQQLHTLHNLAETLEGAAKDIPGVAPTLRDSQLRQQAAVLRDAYVAEPAARLAVVEGEVDEVARQLQKIKAGLAESVGASAVEGKLI